MTRSIVSGSLAAIVLYGCSAAPDSHFVETGITSPPVARGETALPPVTTVVDARPAALVNNRTIGWGTLRPQLSELAGAIALQDLILDQRLSAIAAERSIQVTIDDESIEQSQLLQTLSDDPNTAIRLLDELRRTQGLGPVRFAALLRRNALLRRFIRDQVTIDESAVTQMFDLRYGPRRQVRLITVGSVSQAQDIVREARSGASFADLAVATSTDMSAARGGLLEPIAERDPTYPAALRQAIWALGTPGDVSGPILLDTGYAVVQLVEDVPARDVEQSQVRPELENLVRIRRERILMDQLAQKVLRDARVTIFDPSLHYSWRGR